MQAGSSGYYGNVPAPLFHLQQLNGPSHEHIGSMNDTSFPTDYHHHQQTLSNGRHPLERPTSLSLIKPIHRKAPKWAATEL